jgi:hypothetical protein
LENKLIRTEEKFVSQAGNVGSVKKLIEVAKVASTDLLTCHGKVISADLRAEFKRM